MNSGFRNVRLGLVPLLASAIALSSPAVALASPPTIESESASFTGPADATLEAQLDPQDAERSAYYQFQVAKDPGEFASKLTCPTEGFPANTSLCLGLTAQEGALPIRTVAPGIVTQGVNLDLQGAGATLEPETTYYYRVISARVVHSEDTIRWEEPTVLGPAQSFITPGVQAPTIESESASQITASGATLEARLDPGEAVPGAIYQFQLVSKSSEYASEILCPPRSGGAICIGTESAAALPLGLAEHGSQTRSVSLDLGSLGLKLQPGTTYHYRLLAAHRVLTEDTLEWEAPTLVFGADQTFTTASPGGSPPPDERPFVCPLAGTAGCGSVPTNPPRHRHHCHGNGRHSARHGHCSRAGHHRHRHHPRDF